MEKARVALVKGGNRYDNVARALQLVRDDIAPKIRGKVMIKPNLLSVKRQLASTHVDALRAIVAFVRELSPDEIVIAEGAGGADTVEGYKNFNYLTLEKDYGVALVDLHKETRWKTINLFHEDGSEEPVEISVFALECDCRISAAVAKTHDTARVTLSWKNMMGALKQRHRSQMHGYPAGAERDYPKTVKIIHKNLLRLAEYVAPHISVIDGFTGMEGEGPGGGDEVPFRVAVAGANYVAADAVCAKAMGFEPLEVGYLYYANQLGGAVADLEKIEILGQNIEDVAARFKPHSHDDIQRQWKYDLAKDPVKAMEAVLV